VISFGGMNNDSVQRSMISNDLYVLSLDGQLGSIQQVNKTKKTPIQSLPQPIKSPDIVAK